jgi:hypothetical protein
MDINTPDIGSSPDPEWFKVREWWYSQTYILLEMVKLLQHREMVFLEKKNPTIVDRKSKTIRCCCGYTVDLLKSNFDSFRILDFPFVNLYYSVCHLDKMPLFSFSPVVRAQKYTEWTNGGYKEHWTGYDLCFDFDGETIEQARQDVLKTKKIFDQYKIPYSVRFSGSKGFHLCVDFKWLPQLPEVKMVSLMGELGSMMKVIDNIPSLDDSIFDSRRVMKLPYSFCLGNIVLPLDDYQLENFTMMMVSPEYVIKTIKIKDRGLLERYSDQDPIEVRKSFLELCKNFIDVEGVKNEEVWKPSVSEKLVGQVSSDNPERVQ